ncbi:MAG: hypothetical protein N2315_04025 [Thermanaerothrix sp.]|nr:hypothetical protein [Thermanaerothrix sp.]
MFKSLKACFSSVIRGVAAAVILALLPGVSLGMDEKLAKVIEGQSAKCYVEGQVLGDLVIGARCTVEFVLVDQRLADALRSAQFPPQWLVEQAHKLDSVPKGHSLVAVAVRAHKPFDLEVDKLVVGERLSEGLLMTPKDRMLFQLSSGDESFFGVISPARISRGSVVKVGYGDDLVDMKVAK